MPQLPTVEGPSVGLAPLPGVRQVASPAAGAGAMLQADRLNQISRQVADYAQQQQTKRDLDAVFRAETARNTDYLQQEQDELGKQGNDASGATQRMHEWWQTSTPKYEDGLTERQLFAFRRSTAPVMQGSLQTMARHEHTQTNVALSESAQAKIATAIDAATADPSDLRVENSRKDITEAVGLAGNAQGWAPEVRDQKLAGALTLMHRGVVMQLLDSEQPDQAKAYFDTHKDEIRGETQLVLEKALNHGQMLNRVQAEAQDIVKRFPDLASASDYIDKTYSGEEQQHVRSEVEHRLTIQRETANKVSSDAYGSAMLSIAQGRPVSASAWAGMSDLHKAAVIEKQQEEAKKRAAEAGLSVLREFSAQPIASQQASVDAIDARIAKEGPKPALMKSRKLAAEALQQSQEDYKKEPLRAGLERGVITSLQPIDWSRGVTAALPQLDLRIEQAKEVSKRTGVPTSPLLSDDAAILQQTLAAQSPAQQAMTLAPLYDKVGPKMAAAIGDQIDKHDHAMGLAIKLGSGNTSQSRPASTLLLMGRQALKDKGVKMDDAPVTGDRAKVAAAIPDSLVGQARTDAIDAATLIYQGFKADSQNLDPVRAVNLALGGPVVSHNGSSIPVPAGMDLPRLRDRLASLKPDDIQVQAGPLPTKGLLAPGNIDLASRPIVRNPDGSVSTVRSIGIEHAGMEYLIPTVSDSGRVMTDAQAVDQFNRTGKMLGAFDTAANANAYAKALHEQQAVGIVYDSSGGAQTLKQFMTALPQSQLIPAGYGRYYVRSGYGVALNAKGEKIVIELK